MFSHSAADLTALYTGIYMGVNDAYTKAKPKLRGFAIERTSENAQEAYPIQAISATLTRWVGEREHTNLIQKTAYVVNGDPFAKVLRIKRKDLELKGKTLSWARTATEFGKAAKMKQDEIVRDLLQGGASATCIDGKAFFATDHPLTVLNGAGTPWTNLRANTALSRANFRTTYQAMLSLQGWDGQPFEVDQFYLVVDPTNQAAGQEIVESSFAAMPGGTLTDAVGANNVDRGKAKLVVSQKLSTEPGVWYLLSTVQPPAGEINQEAEFGDPSGSPLSGPFAIQRWRNLEVVARVAPDSEPVFERDEYEYGIQVGYEGGYLLPHHACRCTPP